MKSPQRNNNINATNIEANDKETNKRNLKYNDKKMLRKRLFY